MLQKRCINSCCRVLNILFTFLKIQTGQDTSRPLVTYHVLWLLCEHVEPSQNYLLLHIHSKDFADCLQSPTSTIHCPPPPRAFPKPRLQSVRAQFGFSYLTIASNQYGTSQTTLSPWSALSFLFFCCIRPSIHQLQLFQSDITRDGGGLDQLQPIFVHLHLNYLLVHNHKTLVSNQQMIYLNVMHFSDV